MANFIGVVILTINENLDSKSRNVNEYNFLINKLMAFTAMLLLLVLCMSNPVPSHAWMLNLYLCFNTSIENRYFWGNKNPSNRKLPST